MKNNFSNEIRRDGFFIFRDVFSDSEISGLNEVLSRYFKDHGDIVGLGKHQPQAALHIPELQWIFSDPRIINIFRLAFEGSDPIFTGNCDAHSNMLSWWHKDAIDAPIPTFSGNYFENESMMVYRAGIYLQDQPTRGLSVRLGSHRHKSLDSGKARLLHTKTGDIIIFDIRLTHAGQFADPIERILLKISRDFKIKRQISNLAGLYRRLTRKPEKRSIFFTFGKPSFETNEFIEYERIQYINSSKQRSTG